MKPYYDRNGITLYLGDCREVLPQLTEKVDLVLTDPPYNGDLNYGVMINDSRDWADYNLWLKGIIQQSEQLSNGPVLFFLSKPGLINICATYPPKWVGSWLSSPCNPAGNVNGCLMIPMWEPFLVYGNLNNVRARLKDAYKVNHNTENLSHPCPKPVSLMAQIIQCGEWQSILDPFLGSGTTAVAAKKLGRRCIGIEINEDYLKIAIQRLAQEVLF